MKILLLHVDYIRFRPLKKTLKKNKDTTEKEKKGVEVKEALVVLSAVEKGDGNIEGVVKELVKNIKS